MQVEEIRCLRQRGMSFRDIGYRMRLAPETARQALMRGGAEPHADRTSETLPVGHPTVMRGLWRGLEHWREFEGEPK